MQWQERTYTHRPLWVNYFSSNSTYFDLSWTCWTTSCTASRTTCWHVKMLCFRCRFAILFWICYRPCSAARRTANPQEVVKGLKGVYSSSRQPISELRSVTPAAGHRWTRPTLTPAKQAGTRFTYPGGMEGWVDNFTKKNESRNVRRITTSPHVQMMYSKLYTCWTCCLTNPQQIGVVEFDLYSLDRVSINQSINQSAVQLLRCVSYRITNMHLNLAPLNDAAVHFLASFLRFGATRESYKTETL